MRRNYPDYVRRVDRIGSEQLRLKANGLQDLAHAVNSPQACDGILSQYLELFQEGHLYLEVPRARRAERTGRADPAPSYAATSEATILKLPSLALDFGNELQELVIAHDAEIQSKNTLVIDLRGCSGGADSTYAPLLPYILAGEVKQSGIEFFSTPENILGWELALQGVSDANASLNLGRIVELLRSHPNQFVPHAVNSVRMVEPVARPPRRVVAIVDQDCASSCEQFLIDTRQSKTLITVGTRSAGVLDFSNLVPHLLPGGEGRVLLIPTSRSRRLPADPVDPDGIQPRFAIEAARLRSMSAEDVLKWLDAEHLTEP